MKLANKRKDVQKDNRDVKRLHRMERVEREYIREI